MADKKKTGFGGHLLDMGDRKPEGMDNKPEDNQDKFGGTFTDMGSKDAVGVGEGK
ncbi:MAG: hypothetical protein JWM56_224 [Candidatus Peribacteria bacterium]|nr:hypothetical protein [Candidatus Peribacteria bacterium]